MIDLDARIEAERQAMSDETVRMAQELVDLARTIGERARAGHARISGGIKARKEAALKKSNGTTPKNGVKKANGDGTKLGNGGKVHDPDDDEFDSATVKGSA